MEFIEIKNDEGLTARILTLGATLVSLKFRNKRGEEIDCVLGYDDIQGYLDDKAYMGRTIGRVANRVRNGTFVFKNKEYHLPINCPPHSHHGGTNGTAYKTWEIVRQSVTSVTLRMTCTEETDGFPGDARIDVSYTVNDRNQLVVEHYSRCSVEGVLALAHHPYFNLDGSSTVADHKLYVRADEYLPTDDNCCPTGGQLSVKGTRFDLREPRQLSSFVDSNNVLDIDQDLVLRPATRPGEPAACLSSEKSSIKLTVATSYPVIHVYGSKFLAAIGRNGEQYFSGKGVAIEAQYHSAALNYSSFPDISLVPEKPYRHEVIYTFSHL